MTMNLANELRDLVNAEARNERQCRKYLEHARNLLVDVTSHAFLRQVAEYRGHTGDSDYLISCRVTDGVGGQKVKAYIWEVKAPQCYIFKADTQNRVLPSDDFISAENQLLHYYDEARGSQQFRNEFEVQSPDDVMLGGIIIGSNRTKVSQLKRSHYDEPKLQQLFQHALDLRIKHLYKEKNIKVYHWDRIVDYLTSAVPLKPGTVPDVPIESPLPANTQISSA